MRKRRREKLKVNGMETVKERERKGESKRESEEGKRKQEMGEGKREEAKLEERAEELMGEA